MTEDNKSKTIVGSTELIEVDGIKNVPAKIDTGADTSAIWASDIAMTKDGKLSFAFFGPKSPLYTGERIYVTEYVAKIVRSSHGDEQIRYSVKLPVKIGAKKLISSFTLANRAKNNFPILIGRSTLEGSFLVDVSQSAVERPTSTEIRKLNQELQKDPYAFHRKYLIND